MTFRARAATVHRNSLSWKVEYCDRHCAEWNRLCRNAHSLDDLLVLEQASSVSVLGALAALQALDLRFYHEVQETVNAGKRIFTGSVAMMSKSGRCLAARGNQFSLPIQRRCALVIQELTNTECLNILARMRLARLACSRRPALRCPDLLRLRGSVYLRFHDTRHEIGMDAFESEGMCRGRRSDRSGSLDQCRPLGTF